MPTLESIADAIWSRSGRVRRDNTIVDDRWITDDGQSQDQEFFGDESLSAAMKGELYPKTGNDDQYIVRPSKARRHPSPHPKTESDKDRRDRELNKISDEAHKEWEEDRKKPAMRGKLGTPEMVEETGGKTVQGKKPPSHDTDDSKNRPVDN